MSGLGQVAKLLVNDVGARLPRDFGAGNSDKKSSTRVDHEERVETEQTRTGETSKRKARCGGL